MKSEWEGGAHWLTTASKLVSSKGSSPASPWCQSISGQIRRASANISSLTSSPKTRPSDPARSATSRDSTPVPQPTSKTLSPGLTLAASALLSIPCDGRILAEGFLRRESWIFAHGIGENDQLLSSAFIRSTIHL